MAERVSPIIEQNMDYLEGRLVDLQGQLDKMLNEFVRSANKSTKKTNAFRKAMMRNTREAQGDVLEKFMEDFESTFELVSDGMSEHMKDMYSDYINYTTKAYKSSQKVFDLSLKKQKKGIKETFSLVSDELKNTVNELGSLSAIFTATQLGNVKEQAEESIQSSIESYRDIQKAWNLDDSRMSSVREEIQKVVGDKVWEHGGRMSNSEYMEATSYLIVDKGFKGTAEEAAKLGAVTAEMKKATGADLQDMNNLMTTYTIRKDWDVAGLEQLSDEIVGLSSELNVSSEDLMESVNTMQGALWDRAESEKWTQKQYEDAMSSAAKGAALLEASNIDAGRIMEDFASGSMSDLTKYAQVTNTKELQDKVKAGDIEGATEQLLVDLQEKLKSGQMSNDEVRKWLRETTGLEQGDLAGVLAQNYEELGNIVQKEFEGAADKNIDTATHTSFFDQWGNKLSTLWPVQHLEGLLDDWDIDIMQMVGVLATIKGGISVIKALGEGIIKVAEKATIKTAEAEAAINGVEVTGADGDVIVDGPDGGKEKKGKKGKKSKTKVKGKGKFGGILGKGKSLLGRAGNFLGGIGSKVGGWASSGGRALGDFFSGAGSEVGSAAAKGGKGLLKGLGKIAVPLTIGLDALDGASFTKDWFGENAGADKGFASVLGGALGGTGPGLFDEGDIGDKLWNLGGGALKGAAVGSAIMPGVGTAVGAVVGTVGAAIGGENIAKAADGVGNFVQDRLGDLQNLIGDGLSAGDAFLKQQFGIDIKQDLKKLGAEVSSVFDSANDWIKDNLGIDIKGAVEGFGKNFSNLLVGANQWIKDTFGIDVGQGLADFGKGVEDWWNSLGNREGVAYQSKKQSVDGSHLNGLDYVPKDGYIAKLHRGEAVLTRKENEARNNIQESQLTDAAKGFASEMKSGTVRKAFGAVEKLEENGLQVDTSSMVSAVKYAFEQNDILDNFKGRLIDGFIEVLKKKASILGGLKTDGRSTKGFFGGLFDVLRGFGSSNTSGNTQNPTIPSTGSGNTDHGTGSGTAKSAEDYRHEDLGSWSTMSVQEMNKWINSKARDGSPFKGQGKIFLDAAAKSGLDPRYIVAHAAVESAWGTSKICKDKNNYFGIGAFDSSPYKSAYSFGSGIAAGVIGGAEWISKNYYNGKYNQKSLYTMRNHKSHGYATDPSWDSTIAQIMAGAPANTKYKKFTPSYDVGTPWVPEDQLAMVHKGEMIIPKKYNPINSGESVKPSQASSSEIRELINIMKQGFEFLGKKLDQVSVTLVNEVEEGMVRESSVPQYVR